MAGKKSRLDRYSVISQRMHTNTGLNIKGSIVNPPIERASTILFKDYDEFTAPPPEHMIYGRYGQQVHHEFRKAFAALENGVDSVLTNTGLEAITLTILSLVSTGDEILVTDSCYGSARALHENMLVRLGITVRYFDPMIGGEIADLLNDRTRLVWLESPGTHSFEVQNIPAIVSAIKDFNSSKGAGGKAILSALDNSWAAGLVYKPLDHGVDISLQAVTKYISGHSDVLMGAITMSSMEIYEQIRAAEKSLGIYVAPETVWLSLRGLRSLEARFALHQSNGMALAQWVQKQPFVRQMLHPAFPDCPGHEIWQRDFSGASGLFGFIMEQQDHAAMARLFNNLSLYSMGYSWGGFESLITCPNPREVRSQGFKDCGGQYMRIQVGLENIDDLIADLAYGFEQMLKG